jgi:16S rRNA (guanine966-N2)-methyltransferase
VRVIAGSARGTHLGRVPQGVRPVSDRAREGVFSSLGDPVRGARVLDLYAGTGAMGIEALSRGADRCTFVDRSPASIGAVRSNLDATHLTDRADVIRADAERFVISRGNLGPADLAFVDPPYDLAGPPLDRVLEALATGWLHGDGWRVVMTRTKRNPMHVVPVDWRVARRLEYGDTLVICYQGA